MMNTWQRYRCPACGAEERLPESPTDGPKRVRKGCEDCAAIQQWEAVGRQGPRRRRWSR